MKSYFVNKRFYPPNFHLSQRSFILIIILSTLLQNYASGQCSIDDITFDNISPCNNNNTTESNNDGTANTYEDDTFTADITVFYTDKPMSGTLDLTGGNGIDASISVNNIGSTSYTFQNVEIEAAVFANNTNINVTARFSFNPLCSRFEQCTGCGPRQCSVCPFQVGAQFGTGYQDDCWATEDLIVPKCEDALEYAPDPENPELTPLKVKNPPSKKVVLKCPHRGPNRPC